MTGSRDLHGRTVAALDRIPRDWACIVATDEKPPRLLASREGAGDWAVVVILEEADGG